MLRVASSGPHILRAAYGEPRNSVCGPSRPRADEPRILRAAYDEPRKFCSAKFAGVGFEPTSGGYEPPELPSFSTPRFYCILFFIKTQAILRLRSGQETFIGACSTYKPRNRYTCAELVEATNPLSKALIPGMRLDRHEAHLRLFPSYARSWDRAQ